MTEENKKTDTEEKKIVETPKEIVKDIEKSGVAEEVAKKEEKLDEAVVKKEDKKEEKKKETKREEPKTRKVAFVNVKNIPISTKHSIAVCDFIKGKQIEDAIKDLGAVLKLRKAVPMKGEIPHRKGKGMMSGRFPKNASEKFVKILKSLSANANHGGIEEPVIFEAVANLGERPYGRFGSVRKKRTHLLIKARSKIKKNPEGAGGKI